MIFELCPTLSRDLLKREFGNTAAAFGVLGLLGFAAGMMSFINDIAATDCLTLFPVIGFIRCPNGSRVVSVFRNRCSFFYLMIAGRAISIAGIAFCVAGGFLLVFLICAANMVCIIVFTGFKYFV